MNYKLLLTLGASFALMMPLSAQQQGNGNGKNKSSEKDKKHNKNGNNASSQKANNAAHASAANSAAKANSHHNNPTARVNSAQVNAAQVSRTANVQQQPYYNTASQQRNSSASNQQRYNNAQQNYQNSNQQNYNRNNQYGGYWSPANSHPNWNRNNQYAYNNQNYRWYDGGWLMITAAFTPQYYDNSYYATVDSTVSRVQVRLANQGYYRGAIDGDFGPGTSKAIAGYQNDNGLYVTGQINNALLQSLQVR